LVVNAADTNSQPKVEGISGLTVAHSIGRTSRSSRSIGYRRAVDASIECVAKSCSIAGSAGGTCSFRSNVVADITGRTADVESIGSLIVAATNLVIGVPDIGLLAEASCLILGKSTGPDDISAIDTHIVLVDESPNRIASN
jgi:hypothetical protein